MEGHEREKIFDLYEMSLSLFINTSRHITEWYAATFWWFFIIEQNLCWNPGMF